MTGMRRALLLVALIAGPIYAWLNVAIPVQHLSAYDSDFRNYHLAAQALLAGNSPFTVHNFDYPPLMALVALPLGGFEIETARWIWFFVSQAALLVAAWGTWRLVGHDVLALVVVSVVWCLGGTVQANLVLGQVHPLLLAAIVWSLEWQRRRPGVAALLLAVAAGIKLWPALLFVPALLRRQWRLVILGGALTVSLLIGPLLLFALLLPPPALPASTSYWMGSPAPLNFSLPAVVMRVRDWPAAGEPVPSSWRFGNNPQSYQPQGADALWSVTTAAAVLLFGIATLARRRPGEEHDEDEDDDSRWRFAAPAVIALAMLASPISWYHYQLFQFPGLALLGVVLCRDRRRRLLLPIWVAMVIVLTRTQTLAFGPYAEAYGWTAARPWLLFASTSVVAAFGAALFAWLLWEMGASRSQAGGAS